MADKPTLVPLNSIAPLNLQQWESYLPTAYDEQMTILQKLNKVIQYANELGLLTNQVITKWNEVMAWVMADGLSDAVNEKIDEMVADGTFAKIINVDLFNELRADIDALEGRATTLESDVDGLQATASNLTQNISDLNAEIDQLSNDLANRINAVMDPFITRTDKLIVNVLKYGAKGDGITDNTTAFRNAMEDVKNGGTIRIPYGDYLLHDLVELYPNVSVIADKGTIIRKNMNSISAYTFVTGMTRGTSGYGGGSKNNYIFGITFVGYAESPTRYFSNGFNLHHAQNFHMSDCVFLNCIMNGHALDLGGADNVLIENTDFIGSYNLSGREYTEAIQVDSSTPTATGAEYTGLDGLPTKNVIVRGCKFLPSKGMDGGFMPAPNPIGNHGHTGGMFYENITFENNLVIDAPTSDGGGWRGWVHFYAVKNLKILNNKFKLTQNINARPIGIYVSGGGQYNPVTLVAESGVPQVSKDITVVGNTFEGFKFATQVEMIRMYGTTYNSAMYPVSDIDISHNNFLDNGQPNGAQDSYAPLIMVSSFDRLIVDGNNALYGTRFCSIFNGSQVTVTDNKGRDLTGNFIYLADLVGAVVSGNQSDRCMSPLEFEEVIDAIISGNVNTNIRTYGGDTYACKFRNMNNTVISGNVNHTTEGITNSMYVYLSASATMQDGSPGISNNVKVVDNVHSGFASATPITTSGGVGNLIIRDN